MAVAFILVVVANVPGRIRRAAAPSDVGGGADLVGIAPARQWRPGLECAVQRLRLVDGLRDPVGGIPRQAPGRCRWASSATPHSIWLAPSWACSPSGWSCIFMPTCSASLRYDHDNAGATMAEHSRERDCRARSRNPDAPGRFHCCRQTNAPRCGSISMNRICRSPLDWVKGCAVTDRVIYDIATKPDLIALLRPHLGEEIVLWGAQFVRREPGTSHPWHTDVESAAPDARAISVWIGIRNALAGVRPAVHCRLAAFRTLGAGGAGWVGRAPRHPRRRPDARDCPDDRPGRNHRPTRRAGRRGAAVRRSHLARRPPRQRKRDPDGAAAAICLGRLPDPVTGRRRLSLAFPVLDQPAGPHDPGQRQRARVGQSPGATAAKANERADDHDIRAHCGASPARGFGQALAPISAVPWTDQHPCRDVVPHFRAECRAIRRTGRTSMARRNC